MSGKGRMEWENGDWYEGQFKNNIINGLGVYYKKDKDAYFEGSYKNGLKNGKGKVKIGSY